MNDLNLVSNGGSVYLVDGGGSLYVIPPTTALIVKPGGISRTPYTLTASNVSNQYFQFSGGQRIDFLNIPLSPTSAGITIFIRFRWTGSSPGDFESLFCFNRTGAATSGNPFNVDVFQYAVDTIFFGRSGTGNTFRPAFTGSSTNTNSVTFGTIVKDTDYLVGVRWTGATTTADTAYSLSYWLSTTTSLSGATKNKTQFTSTASPSDGIYQLCGVGHQNQRNGYGFFTGFIYYLYMYNRSFTDTEITNFVPT